MDKLESVARNNLSWLDSEMCDHITQLGDYTTAFLCSLPTCEKYLLFGRTTVFQGMDVVEH